MYDQDLHHLQISSSESHISIPLTELSGETDFSKNGECLNLFIVTNVFPSKLERPAWWLFGIEIPPWHWNAGETGVLILALA